MKKSVTKKITDHFFKVSPQSQGQKEAQTEAAASSSSSTAVQAVDEPSEIEVEPAELDAAEDDVQPTDGDSDAPETASQDVNVNEIAFYHERNRNRNRDNRRGVIVAASLSGTSVSECSDMGPANKRRRNDETLFKVDPLGVIAARTVLWAPSKESKKRKQPDLGWPTEYPWLQFLYADKEKKGPIIGMLCRECRAVAATKFTSDVQILFSRSKQAFINHAYNNWEHGGQKLFHHEFGDASNNPNAPHQNKHAGSSAKTKLRERMMVSPYQTTHMRWFSETVKRRGETVKRRELESTGQDIQTVVLVSGSDAACSPVFRFQREIKFMHLLEVTGIKLFVNRYTSRSAIRDFTSALHMTLLYGLYLDLLSACEESEDMSFSVMVDLASTSRTREWTAVCLRYVSTAAGGEVCERLLKVSHAESKTGLSVMNAIRESIEWFNEEIGSLCQKCPFLFDADGPRKLDLVNCSAYGSDGGGGARSKFVSVNCRIRAFNPRIIDWWCGSHRVQLASKRASQGNRFLSDNYDATKQLQKFLTMSAEVDVIFKRSQQAVYSTPAGSETAFTDKAMFKWETENDCLAKEAKLHKAIAQTIVEVQRCAKDPNSRRWRTHYLAQLVVKSMRILYVGLKRDILRITVQLIRKTEVTGVELAEYDVAVSRALAQLQRLSDRDGPLYSQAKQSLSRGDYPEFQLPDDEPLDELYIKADEHRNLAVASFVEQVESYLSPDKRSLLKGYDLLSMDKMALNVMGHAELADYGAEAERELAQIFCHPYDFKGTWPEDKDVILTAPALGSEADLHDQLGDLKFQMYDLIGLPVSARSTRNVLLRLIKSKSPCVRDKTILRKIIKGYLELPLSTSGVECVFSAVRLTDTRLCMKRSDSTVNKYISIIMESEQFESFDIDLAVTIWEKLRTRRVTLSPGSRVYSDDKPILRSMAKKAAGRTKKFEYRSRQYNRDVTAEAATDDDDVVIDDTDWFGAVEPDEDDEPFLGFTGEDIADPNSDVDDGEEDTLDNSEVSSEREVEVLPAQPGTSQ